jgi:hypothetical protein
MVYHACSDYAPQKLKALHIHKGKTLNFIICTQSGNCTHVNRLQQSQVLTVIICTQCLGITSVKTQEFLVLSCQHSLEFKNESLMPT